MAPARGVDINGAAVRAIRELRGVNLSRFATDVMVSTGFMCNIETGRKTRVSPQVRERIRARLDCTLDAISYVGATAELEREGAA